jgi:membrane fusion protein, multidrug efflux system
MRIVPLLTSTLVAATLYGVIMERDRLRSFAGGTPQAAPEVQVAAQSAADQPPVSVVVVRSNARTVENGIVLRGRTEAARKVDVRAETGGLVISEPLRKGARVEAGQLLCELDPGTRLAQLSEARAQLAVAEVNNRTAASLAEKGFSSETTVIARKAALETAAAAVQFAEKDIARLRIAAPFAGILESDTAEIGSLLQPGSHCATVIDLSKIKLVGFAPENAINRIKTGATAVSRLLSGEQLVGVLTFVSRSADPQTRTYRVEVEVDNPGQKIRDGATAEILIAFAGEKAHLLPQAALTLDDEGRLGVRVATADGVAKFLPVEVIRDTAEGIWLSGLPASVDVIVVGQEYVEDGRKLIVTTRELAK